MQKRKGQSLGCWGSTTTHLGLFEQGLDVPLFLGPFLFLISSPPIITQTKHSPWSKARLTTTPQ